MPTNMREAILDAVETVLDAIEEADGYSTSPRVFRESAAPPVEPTMCPMITISDGPERREYLASRQVECELDVIIRGFAQDDAKVSQNLNDLMYDIDRAIESTTVLNVASQQSGQAFVWGQMAGQVETFMGDEGIGEVRVTLTVHFRRTWITS